MMAVNLENYGLEFFWEDDKALEGLLNYSIQTGKALVGYSGAPYFFKPLGNAELWVDTEILEKSKTLQVTGFDAHCGGNCVWELFCTGIEIKQDEGSPLKRTLMFRGTREQKGLLPVEVITADVLPGLLEGDVVRLQMIAQPLDIHYHTPEEADDETLFETSDGNKWGIADGSLLALSFLSNHNQETYGDDRIYPSDSFVHFKATVTRLYHGVFELEEKRENLFIRCFAETAYGELEFDHTLEQVPEEERANIRVGSVISGVCILSGDAAIDEYENGIIKNLDHDLRLLRYTLVRGEAKRMKSVLAPDAVSVSEVSGQTRVGADAIVERMNAVHEKAGKDRSAEFAVVTGSEDSDTPVGTRCVVIRYEGEDDFSSAAFLSVNEKGLIEKIRFCSTDGLTYRLEETPKQNEPSEDFQFSDSLEEPIVNRAIFHNFLGYDVDADAVINDIPEYETLEDNAQRMLDALEREPQPDVETALKNVFGYLFAKSIEHTLREAAGESPAETLSPAEAFSGKPVFGLDPEQAKKLGTAYDLGKQFFKDLEFYVRRNEISETDFAGVFRRAAALVQHVGRLYAQSLING